MLFPIMGASGSGKSVCLAGLQQHRPDMDWHDFDDLAVLPTNTAERQAATEHWLQRAVRNEGKGVNTGLAGTMVLGQVLACPSAAHLPQICSVLLDCHDVVRIDQIRARDGNSVWATQEMLCWAAWQRMHAVDPQWRQDVIQAHGAEDMQWERWSSWQRGDPRWQVEIMDNTLLTVEQTTHQLVAWVAKHSKS